MHPLPQAAAASSVPLIKTGEDETLRTANSKTVRNADGTRTTTVFAEPIHFKDGGKWRAIDSSIEMAKDGQFSFKNKANAFSARFKNKTSSEFLRLKTDGPEIGLSLDGAADAPAAVDGSRITYSRPLPGTDLRYDVTATALKETLVLTDRSAPSTYRFRLASPDGSDLRAEPTGVGQWEIWANGHDGALFTLDPSWAAEAGLDGEAHSGDDPHVTTTVTPSAGGLEVVLQVDRTWLYASERQFPVLVDPTITLQGPSLDASFKPNSPTSVAQTTRGRLSIGADATDAWRSALKFNLGELPGSANLTSAELQLWFDDHCILSGCSSPYTLTAHKVTGSWTTGSTSSAFTFDSTALDSVTTSTTDFEWLEWDITQLTKDWLDSITTNNGVLLKSSAEAANSDGPSLPARGYSSEATLAPRIVVTYSGDAVDLAAPHTLHANGAELEWAKFSGTTFTKYEVHRSATTPFAPSSDTRLATITDIDVTTFRDTTAAPNTTFTYKIVANSSGSNPRTVTLPPDGKSSKVLQPGPDEANDVYISYHSAFVNCNNHGKFEKLAVSAITDATRRPLVRFDLRDVPKGVTVDSATMSLWHPYPRSAVNTINVHRVTSDWVEGTGVDTGCTKDGATWYDRNGGVKWNTAGGDFDTSVAGSHTSTGPEGTGWHNFALTSLVQDWLDGDKPNQGVILKQSDETLDLYQNFHYWSADHTDAPTVRPKLTLTYTDGTHAQGPAVSVTAPAAGSTVSGTTVSLKANATDDRRVDKVEFYVDGVLKNSDTMSAFAYTWDSTTVSNGSRSITAKAYDDAGNSTTSAAVSVTVANTAPPTVSISPGSGGAYATAVAADSPRGWWRMNETSGTTAADASGNGYNGTYRGNTALNYEGALADDASIAAHFPGTNDHDVSIPDNNGLDFGTGDFTAEAWVKTAVNGERIIMGKFNGLATSPTWRISVTNDSSWLGRIRVNMHDGLTSKQVYGPTIRVDDDKWHHVAVVFARSSGITVYVDGVGRTTTGVPSGSVNNSDPLRIGDTDGYSAFQGDIDEAAVYPTALSATRVRAHFDAGVMRGSHTLNATASDDVGVSKVEFYADGVKVGEDTSSPYSAAVNTLDAALPLYDGPRAFTARAYDTSNQVTTSAAVNRTVANGGYSKYRGTMTSTAVPPVFAYDPAQSTQQQVGVDVTVTNKSTLDWTAADVKLRYRWISNDATAVYTDSSPVALSGTLADGGSATLRLLIDPPTLPDGVDHAAYRLRFDMYDYGTSQWFAANGNQPIENPIVVNRKIETGLGLERYYNYDSEPVGLGMNAMTNVASGNMLLHWTPFSSPGRGLSTVVNLTYNSFEKGNDSPAGNNFSLAISSLTRLGSRLDVHPNGADTIAGNANKFVDFTDGDGTTHRFEGAESGGVTHWKEPAGVHLYLRVFSTTDTTKKWALTRPDKVTFFYDVDGYPTGVEDAFGNRLHFTLSAVDPGDEQGGPQKRVTAVTDATGLGGSPQPNRTYNIDYYTKAEVKKAQQRGKVQRITDHDGTALDFEYYEDGNLLRLTRRSAADAAIPANLQTLTFTYTTSAGDGPAITTQSARLDPDPRTSPQSTRLYSVIDSRDNETVFTYYGPTSGQLRWKLASRTNRTADATSYAYNISTRVTTATAPLSRVTTFAYDAQGKVVSITNPLSQTTGVEWTSDYMVQKVTEPTGEFTVFAYNDNGYLTESTDQVGNKTVLEYTDSAVDANDVLGKWRTGRQIAHLSRLNKKTDPNGTATTSPTDDFQWLFGYTGDALTAVTDPEGYVTTYGRDGFGQMTSLTNARGKVTEFTYDANGLVDKVNDANEKDTRFGRNADGLLLWTQDANHMSFQSTGDTDPANRRNRTYTDYDGLHRPVKQSTPKSTAADDSTIVWTEVEYDDDANIVTSYRPEYGGVVKSSTPKTTTTYDDMDRPIEVLNPESEKVQTVYDDAGRVTKQTSPLGVETTGTDQDYSVLFEYDALDRVVRQKRNKMLSHGSSTIDETLVSHACYNTAGDLIWTTSPKAGITSALSCTASPPSTFTTTFTYDDAHKPLTTTDPEGHTTSVTYDANGNVNTQTDANGNVTTLDYDERGLPTKVTEPFDTGVSPTRTVTTKIVYDQVGNQKELISPRAWDASSDKQTFTHYVTKYVYDDVDRLTRVDLPTSNASTWDGTQLYIHRGYDNVGNVTMTSLPTTSTLSPGAADRTEVEYWDTGWVRTTKIGTRDPVLYDYTAFGAQARRDGKDARGKPKIETWEYHPDGPLAAHKDPGEAISTYEYTSDNQLESAVQQTTNDSKEIVAIYDTLGQLVETKAHKPGDTSNYRYTKMTYDDNGNVAEREEDGRVGTPDFGPPDPRFVEFTYDEADWLQETLLEGTTNESGADDQLVEFDYSHTGLESERRFKSASGGTQVLRQKTVWTHFANGKLKTVETRNADATPLVLESHTVGYYDSSNIYVNGNRTSDAFMLRGPDGAAPCRTTTCTATYSYDARDKLKSTSDGRGNTRTYTLSPTGNVEAEALNGTTTASYTYGAGILESMVSGGATSKYFYDLDGNLECITGGTSSSLSDCGDTTGSTPSANLKAQYKYDYLNQVDKFTRFANQVKDDEASYQHDALGRVTKQIEDPGLSSQTTMTFGYIGLSGLLAAETHDGARDKTITYGYDAFGHRLTMSDDPTGVGDTQNYSYGYDVHGNTSLLVNQQDDGVDAPGTVEAAYGYQPYGAQDAGITKGDPEDDDPLNPMRYSARRWDAVSESLDMGARRYDAGAGRFLQFDQFNGALADLGLSMDPLTGNRHALAGGNPVGYAEWDGHTVRRDGGGNGTSYTRAELGEELKDYQRWHKEHRSGWQKFWDGFSSRAVGTLEGLAAFAKQLNDCGGPSGILGQQCLTNFTIPTVKQQITDPVGHVQNLGNAAGSIVAYDEFKEGGVTQWAGAATFEGLLALGTGAVGKAGTAGRVGGAGTVAAGGDDTVSLFRAVSQAEADDISRTVGFRPAPSGASLESKLFATSADDAASFGRINYGFDGEAFHIVEARVPRSFADSLHRFTADRMPVVGVDVDQLSTLNRLGSWSIWNRVPWVPKPGM